MKQADLRDTFRKASKSVSALTVVVSPNPLSPSPSTSSASLVESEETPENTEGDPDALEPAAEGDIQMEYSSE
jgi:hypothetical protein